MKRLENIIEQKKKDILNIAHKRKILIDNIAAIISQFASHEKGIISKVSSNFSNLMAIANTYPNLMGNNAFLDNYHQLEKLENELQSSMSDYNQYITQHNDKAIQFPDMILAAIFGFKKRIYAERN